MAVIAVAGGTGDVGKTIVAQLLLSGKDKVLVLSRRKASANPPAEGNPETLVIDYKDIDSIAKTLEANNVDTVICAMYVAGSAERAQLNLIKAADKSSTTRRFIPSEYAGYVPLGEIVTDEMRAPLLRAAEALERTRLMYTRVACGMFMDYFGQPRIPSHLRPFNWAINIPLRRAAIPGTGNEPLSLTYSKDVAQFIERLLAEHEWPKYSIICGSDTTLNEVVAIAERVTGDTFQVTYDSISKLKQGNATLAFTESASYGGVDLTAAVGLSVVEGQVALPKEERLNQKFPDIHPIGIEELIKKAWSQE